MTIKATEDILNTLHGALAAKFIKIVASDTCTAAELAQARQFLRDNNIEATKDNPAMDELGGRVSAAQFPVFSEDEQDVIN